MRDGRNELSPSFRSVAVFVLFRPPKYSSNTHRLGKTQHNVCLREIRMIPSQTSQAKDLLTNRPGAFHCYIFCMPPAHYLEYGGLPGNDSCRRDALLLKPCPLSCGSNMGTCY